MVSPSIFDDPVIAGLEGGSAPKATHKPTAAPGGKTTCFASCPPRATVATRAMAVEYGRMGAAIAAVIVLGVFLLGGVVKDKFNKTCGAINSTGGTGTSC